MYMYVLVTWSANKIDKYNIYIYPLYKQKPLVERLRCRQWSELRPFSTKKYKKSSFLNTEIVCRIFEFSLDSIEPLICAAPNKIFYVHVYLLLFDDNDLGSLQCIK